MGDGWMMAVEVVVVVVVVMIESQIQRRVFVLERESQAGSPT